MRFAVRLFPVLSLALALNSFAQNIPSFDEVITSPALCRKWAPEILQRIDPESSPENAVRFSMLLLCTGKIDDAKVVLERADGKFKDNFLVKYNLGVIEILRGRWDFAVFYLNRAKKIRATPELYKMLVLAYTNYGDVKSALRVLEEAQERFPEHKDFKLLKAVYLLKLRKVDEAEREASEYIFEDRFNPLAYLVLAKVSEMRGDIESAIRYADRTAELSRVAKGGELFLLWSASFAHKLGYPERASEYYIGFLKSGPARLTRKIEATARFLSSAVLRDLGFYFESDKNYRRSLELWRELERMRPPYDVERRFRLALEFWRKGNIKGAQRELESLLALEDYPPAKALLSAVLLTKALAFENEKKKLETLRRVRELAREYLEQNPSDTRVMYILALANWWLAQLGPRYEKVGNLIQAVSVLQSAVKLEPERKEYAKLLGLCYWQLERYEDALEQLQKSGCDDRFCMLILTDIYLRYGKLKEARRIFESLGELGKVELVFLWDWVQKYWKDKAPAVRDAILEGEKLKAREIFR